MVVPSFSSIRLANLTIKSSDEFGYFLGFPNQEVKQALYEEGKGILDWGITS